MKFPTATSLTTTLLLALYIIFGAIPENLIWQSKASFSWQLVSAHFVHISVEHLAWNLLAFIIFGSMIEQHSVKRLFIALGIGGLFVSLYLLSLFELPAYAGLSGILNTLLVTALYQIAWNPKYRTAALLSFIASMAKLGFEWSSDEAIFSSLIWPSVPQAHLAGMLAGLVLCLVLHNSSRLIKKEQTVLYN